jgi:hypothetical protein
MTARPEALMDALDRFRAFAYLDAPGFAFHGPMGAETLSTLGHDDLVAGWVERYKARHQPLDAPPPTMRIDPTDERDWRTALGDMSRVSDWAEMFTVELVDRPWQAVLQRWLPALLPGSGGALTHGLLRVAHAVRSLPVEGPPPEPLRTELARALAFWAAAFTPLAGRPSLGGTLDLPAAIAGLPFPDPAWSVIEAGTFARIGELNSFPAAVAALGAPGDDIDRALSELTAAFCRAVLANADVFPLPLVHAVTPVSGVRTLLPHMPAGARDAVYAQMWHVSAAILVGFTRQPTTLAAIDRDGVPPAMDDIVARAIDNSDVHALKFAEACAREHAISPDPAYVLAAKHVVERLPAW